MKQLLVTILNFIFIITLSVLIQIYANNYVLTALVYFFFWLYIYLGEIIKLLKEKELIYVVKKWTSKKRKP
jgi:hypothetical protein